jgi:hypothetical protein
MSDDKEFLDKLKLDLEEIGLYDSLDGEVSLLDLAKNFSRAAEHYRELIEEAEARENIDDFLVKRIKRDLEIVDMPESDELEIHIGDKDNE